MASSACRFRLLYVKYAVFGHLATRGTIPSVTTMKGIDWGYRLLCTLKALPLYSTGIVCTTLNQGASGGHDWTSIIGLLLGLLHLDAENKTQRFRCSFRVCKRYCADH